MGAADEAAMLQDGAAEKCYIVGELGAAHQMGHHHPAAHHPHQEAFAAGYPYVEKVSQYPALGPHQQATWGSYSASVEQQHLLQAPASSSPTTTCPPTSCSASLMYHGEPSLVPGTKTSEIRTGGWRHPLHLASPSAAPPSNVNAAAQHPMLLTTHSTPSPSSLVSSGAAGMAAQHQCQAMEAEGFAGHLYAATSGYEEETAAAQAHPCPQPPPPPPAARYNAELLSRYHAAYAAKHPCCVYEQTKPPAPPPPPPGLTVLADRQTGSTPTKADHVAPRQDLRVSIKNTGQQFPRYSPGYGAQRMKGGPPKPLPQDVYGGKGQTQSQTATVEARVYGYRAAPPLVQQRTTTAATANQHVSGSWDPFYSWQAAKQRRAGGGPPIQTAIPPPIISGPESGFQKATTPTEAYDLGMERTLDGGKMDPRKSTPPHLLYNKAHANDKKTPADLMSPVPTSIPSPQQTPEKELPGGASGMGQRYLSEERGEGLEQNRAEGDGGTVGASGARAAAGEAQASGKGAWSLGNIYDRIMSGNGFMSSIAHTEPKKQDSSGTSPNFTIATTISEFRRHEGQTGDHHQHGRQGFSHSDRGQQHHPPSYNSNSQHLHHPPNVGYNHHNSSTSHGPGSNNLHHHSQSVGAQQQPQPPNAQTVLQDTLRYCPERLATIDADTAWAKDSKVTTVMIRNIPNRYTTEDVLSEIDSRGFYKTYNYFYLPIDFANKVNMGYAFLNFLAPKHVDRFAKEFHDTKLPKYATSKILEICAAGKQGLEENVARFLRRDSNRIQNPFFLPLVFGWSGRSEWQAYPLTRENLIKITTRAKEVARELQKLEEAKKAAGSKGVSKPVEEVAVVRV